MSGIPIPEQRVSARLRERSELLMYCILFAIENGVAFCGFFGVALDFYHVVTHNPKTAEIWRSLGVFWRV